MHRHADWAMIGVGCYRMDVNRLDKRQQSQQH